MDRLAPGGGEHVVIRAAPLGTYSQPLLGLALAVFSKYLHGFGVAGVGGRQDLRQLAQGPCFPVLIGDRLGGALGVGEEPGGAAGVAPDRPRAFPALAPMALPSAGTCAGSGTAVIAPSSRAARSAHSPAQYCFKAAAPHRGLASRPA